MRGDHDPKSRCSTSVELLEFQALVKSMKQAQPVTSQRQEKSKVPLLKCDVML